MVEKAQRSEVGDHPRDDEQREWEIFARKDESSSMRHVGSVSAPSPGIAHEQASRLFAWFATDVWICPADETHRFSTHDLDDEAAPAPTSEDGENGPVTVDSGNHER